MVRTAVCGVVFVVVPLLQNCTVNRFRVRRPEIDNVPVVNSRAKAEEAYIRARDYERRGLLKIAEREYENALQYDPESRVLKRELIRIYVASGKFTQALLLVKNGRKNEDLDREEKRIISTIYLKMNEIEKAAWVLESIKDKTAEEAYSLAWIYESIGKREKALPLYLRYFSENPDEQQLGFKIARLMLQLGKGAMVDSFLVALQEHEGKSADLYNMRAMVAITAGDTAAGLSCYDSALSIDSLHEETIRGKAQIYIERNDYPSAIECYRRLVAYYSYGDIYNRTLALLYFHNRQYAEAEEMIQQLLMNAMDDAELHYYLGLVYAATDRKELAGIEFEKSLAIKGENDEVWRELCSLYLKDQRYDKAYTVALRFVEKFPERPAAWRLKGYVATLQKNFIDAVKAYRKVISIDSTDAYSWFELGSSLERGKKIDSAVIAFKKVLAFRPDDPATLNYLGYMWAERGEHLDTAEAYLNRALAKEPRNGAFLDSYAWVLYQKKQYDSALIYLEMAIGQIDDDPVIFSHLGDIFTKLGRLHEAVDAFEKSIELQSEEEDALRRKIIDLEILLKNE